MELDPNDSRPRYKQVANLHHELTSLNYYMMKAAPAALRGTSLLYRLPSLQGPRSGQLVPLAGCYGLDP